MDLTSQTKLSQSHRFSSTELDDARVFLDIESGDYLSLKGPGLAIWESLATPLDVDELVRRLALRYGIDRERCTRDTLPFLQELLSAGLLEELPPERTA